MHVAVIFYYILFHIEKHRLSDLFGSDAAGFDPVKIQTDHFLLLSTLPGETSVREGEEEKKDCCAHSESHFLLC